MFSVIIPTVWKSKRTAKLISDLNKCETVKEIIIIDNNPKQKNVEDSILNIKSKIFSFEENMYVNPSWNFGVEKSNQENIALCNDDINFDPIVFEKIYVENNTIIGLDVTSYRLYKTTDIDLKTVDRMGYGFGCLMLFQKKYYKYIPEKFKIWYGDNFLFRVFENRKTLIGLRVDTEMSTSSASKEFREIIENDKILWKEFNILKYLDSLPKQ